MPEIFVYFITTPGLRQQVCHLQTPSICHKPELKLGFQTWSDEILGIIRYAELYISVLNMWKITTLDFHSWAIYYRNHFDSLFSYLLICVFIFIPPANKACGYIGITMSICLSVCLSVRRSMYIVSANPPKLFNGFWWNFIWRLGIICRCTRSKIIIVGCLQREIIQLKASTCCKRWVSLSELTHSSSSI